MSVFSPLSSKAKQRSFVEFCNDSSAFSSDTTYGLTHMGRYSVSGDPNGTYPYIVDRVMVLKRIRMITNGDEYTGGTFEGLIYLAAPGEGLTIFKSTGAIPRANWIQEGGYGGATQDSAVWLSSPLNMVMNGSPERPLFLTTRVTTDSVTGGPEGFSISLELEEY